MVDTITHSIGQAGQSDRTDTMDPGRLGILLQMEAVVGIGSAAVLTDEPFGRVELLGTILVVGAGVVDVLGGRGSNNDT